MRMAILSVCLLLASAGFARGQARGDYAALIRDAVSEYNVGNYAEARLLFSKAHALRPSARTLRGMGLSDFELKRYALAIEELSGALAATDHPLTPEHRELVETALARAREYAARYTLELPPGVTEIEVDGHVRALPESRELVLDPGPHRLAIVSSGERLVRELDAELGARGRVSFAVGDGESAPLARDGSEPTIATEDARTSAAGRTFTWIAAGATGLFAVGIVTFGVLASDQHDEFRELDARCPDCDDDAIAQAREDGERYQTLTNVSIALTGVAAATAVTLFFLEPQAGDERLALRVAPAGVTLSGAF